MDIQKIHEFTENASPDNWLKYGDELRLTAHKLWQHKGDLWIDFNSETKNKKERPAVSRSFMLIAGLSLENLLKGYIIAIEPSYISNGVIDKKIQTHNLVKLGELCDGIIFDENDTELMTILSEAIPYWGRYPIPLRYENLKTEKIASEGILSTFQQIFDKVFNATLEKIKNGWDAGNGIAFNSFKFHNYDNK